MSEILFQYERISPTTWVYISSLMTIGLFFKFGRLWSVRNLDLLLLIALAPGLLMVVQGEKLRRTVPETIPEVQPTASENSASPPSEEQTPPAETELEPFLVVPEADGDVTPGSLESDEPREGTDFAVPLENGIPEDPADLVGLESVEGPAASAEVLPENVIEGRRVEAAGYIWLFVVGLLLLGRLLVDANMVRRPLLEPNLTSGGMVFLGCALLVFLMANVITGSATNDDLYGPATARDFMARRDTSGDEDALAKHGPGLRVISMLPSISTNALVEPPEGLPRTQQEKFAEEVTAKSMAILSHLAIVVGMVMIGYWHFGNIKMGIGAATLYLLMPYTAEMTGRVAHALPGALLIWAIATYRRPLVSGMFFGLAAGVIYYPLFLLPLWCSFYWQRGLARFAGGVLAMLAILSLSLVFTSEDFASFWLQFKAQFGLHAPAMDALEGIWRFAWDSAYRIPILAAFIALSGTLALWPPRKNFGTLLSCSGVVMLAVQFWTGYYGGGGTIMAWYLPLLLLTVFRPNLEDRVAISVLDKGQWPRLAKVNQAA